jgi:hypothetical protein
MLLAGAGAAAASAAYRDVPRKHWAFQEAQWVRGTGLIPNSQGPNFQGKKGMTRYEMAQVLSGYMRDYYTKRDAIQTELTELKQVGATHDAQMKHLEERQQVVSRKIDSGAVPTEAPPEPEPEVEEPVAAAPTPAPSPRGSTLKERLEAMRAKIRASRGGGSAPKGR